MISGFLRQVCIPTILTAECFCKQAGRLHGRMVSRLTAPKALPETTPNTTGGRRSITSHCYQQLRQMRIKAVEKVRDLTQSTIADYTTWFTRKVVDTAMRDGNYKTTIFKELLGAVNPLAPIVAQTAIDYAPTLEETQEHLGTAYRETRNWVVSSQVEQLVDAGYFKESSQADQFKLRTERFSDVQEGEESSGDDPESLLVVSLANPTTLKKLSTQDVEDSFVHVDFTGEE